MLDYIYWNAYVLFKYLIFKKTGDQFNFVSLKPRAGTAQVLYNISKVGVRYQ